MPMDHSHWDIQLERKIAELSASSVRQDLDLRGCPTQLFRERPHSERVEELCDYVNVVSSDSCPPWICVVLAPLRHLCRGSKNF